MANVIKGQDGRKLQEPNGLLVKIWVVDDDDDFRELLRRTLNINHGFDCSHQFSSAPLMLAALQLLPPPDVILLDFQMPEMNGIEALPRIQQLAPTTAVLMLSTFFDVERRQEALAAGARGYHRKTEPVTSLMYAIRAAQKNPPPVPVLNPPPVTGIARLCQLIFGA